MGDLLDHGQNRQSQPALFHSKAWAWDPRSTLTHVPSPGDIHSRDRCGFAFMLLYQLTHAVGRTDFTMMAL